MSLLALLIVSILTAMAIVWLISYASNYSTVFGHEYSPRLIWVKFLPLIDIVLTILLIIVPMFTGISGIGTFIASAFTAAGLTVGMYFVRKVMAPRWKRQFEEKCKHSFVIN